MKKSFRALVLLLPLLLVFFDEPVFWGYFFETSADPTLRLVELLTTGLGLAAALWYWRRMEPVVRGAMLLTVIYLLALVLESYAAYGTWVAYGHVFSKVLVLFTLYGTYGFYHRRGLPSLKLLVGVVKVYTTVLLGFLKYSTTSA